MLYNPKWAPVETNPDVFSLDDLIAWLETMPANKVYCYLDHGHCLIGQYVTARGFANPHVYSDGYFKHGPKQENRLDYPTIFNCIALGNNRTFGGALKRARAARVSPSL